MAKHLKPSRPVTPRRLNEMIHQGERLSMFTTSEAIRERGYYYRIRKPKRASK